VGVGASVAAAKCAIIPLLAAQLPLTAQCSTIARLTSNTMLHMIACTIKFMSSLLADMQIKYSVVDILGGR